MIPIPEGKKVLGLTEVGLTYDGGRYKQYVGFTVIPYRDGQDGQFELKGPDGYLTGWFNNEWLKSHFIIAKSKQTVVTCSRKAIK